MGLLKTLKEKKEVKTKAKKEAEQIFKKTNPKMAMKDGSFPKTGPMMPRAYNKAAKAVEKQVVDTRIRMYKAKKK